MTCVGGGTLNLSLLTHLLVEMSYIPLFVNAQSKFTHSLTCLNELYSFVV